MSMHFHPYSEIFPLLPDDELQALADDIKSFGLREPIWLYEGQILDGRNRWLACQKARIDPQTRTFRGTSNGALALVVSNNIQRRHLTAAEKAFAGARISELRAGDNQHTKEVTARAVTSSSQAEIAEKLGTSPDSIQRAKKVLEGGSKALQKAAESGEVSLKKAAAATKLPKKEQLAAAKSPKEKPSKPKESPADLGEFLTTEEVARQEADEKRYLESLQKAAGDSAAEIKRLNDLLSEAYRARDRYMNECAAMRKQLTAKDREIARLKKTSKAAA